MNEIFDNTVIEPGKYPAKAVRARYDDSIITGAGDELEAVMVVFRLENGKELPEWPGWFGDDDEKNMKTDRALQFCGWKGPDPRALEGIDKNFVQVVVDTKSWITRNGDTVKESFVRYVNKLPKEKQDGPARANTSPKGQQRAAKIARMRMNKNAPAAPATSFGDDDVPF